MTRKELIQHAVIKAGEAILKILPSEGVVEKIGRSDLLTAGDLASEKIIMDLIKANYPGDAILSEETTTEITDFLNLPALWVIDPIDGTNNFRYERHYSAISIGYYENGVGLLGAIYNPFRNELFFAEKDHGAYLNKEKIHVGQNKIVEKSVVATDNSAFSEGTARNLKLLLQIEPTPLVLIKGSAVLIMADVACGRVDLYFHTYLKPWDNAAAMILLQEAGAKICGLQGEEITFLSPNAIVGNGILVDQCVRFLT
ncbi:MAG: inositol monophosphatase [bacterium]|nr:inositol monophosphatase [bacterium]